MNKSLEELKQIRVALIEQQLKLSLPSLLVSQEKNKERIECNTQELQALKTQNASFELEYNTISQRMKTLIQKISDNQTLIQDKLGGLEILKKDFDAIESNIPEFSNSSAQIDMYLSKVNDLIIEKQATEEFSANPLQDILLSQRHMIASFQDLGFSAVPSDVSTHSLGLKPTKPASDQESVFFSKREAFLPPQKSLALLSVKKEALTRSCKKSAMPTKNPNLENFIVEDTEGQNGRIKRYCTPSSKWEMNHHANTPANRNHSVLRSRAVMLVEENIFLIREVFRRHHREESDLVLRCNQSAGSKGRPKWEYTPEQQLEYDLQCIRGKDTRQQEFEILFHTWPIPQRVISEGETLDEGDFVSAFFRDPRNASNAAKELHKRFPA